MNKYICELLLLLLSLLLLLVAVCFLYTHIFFLCLRGSLQEWTLLLLPNQYSGKKPKTLSGLIQFSANTLTLPASSCKRLMWQDGCGSPEYLEEKGKVVEVSAKPASQLSSITTNRCWQLESLEMQPNHLGNLIRLLESPWIGRPCAPNSLHQVNEGYSPYPEEKQPQAYTPHGKSPWGLEQWFSIRVDFTPHQLHGNDWRRF